ncbi:PIG-L deacetylase family protein [Gloeobacter violaceus]|uniref:Glr3049 protein n=1 Tax=Gloeobacter violaceus (strain ATCC 29082 / PCC 7421) TaxID=251221 RepID=Q7NCD0_GLOVI|nr:PIG-L deacetylase family protein [Gloeobacter violaceus]BAC90990.1 glr3049 [Gloeobacter violaceus PCC 7421]
MGVTSAALGETPLHPPEAAAALGSTLVVAPHPDDESLGCGGTIALLRRLGLPVRVLVVSDGTRSHPNSRRYPPAALRALREAEARAALAVLGVAPAAVTFLGLKDGAVPFEGDADFADALGRCRRYLAQLEPVRTVVLPWRRDPHPDHRAVWNLMHRASDGFTAFARSLEYPIWLWEQGERFHRPMEGEVCIWRLAIGPVLALKRAAVAAHRSQTSDLIDDDPEGFRLTPETLTHFERPWECYLEAPCNPNAPR